MSLFGLFTYVFAFLLALSMHEFAHGAVSYRLGDPTPAYAGRLTLNPLAHLDLMGSLAFLISIQAGLGFGWAKPVPVDPRYYRNYKKGLVLVGLAGPLANFTLAFVFSLLLKVLINNPFWVQFLLINILVNISLGVFNLVPIPPLDGSKVLYGLLPYRYTYRWYKFEQYGPLILLLLVFSGVIGQIVRPMIVLLQRLFLL
ncbi:MAG: site-2 protease family protein [Firmicutes bacterium]|nr:site-2 protease family protein [Bacillota bacterium]